MKYLVVYNAACEGDLDGPDDYDHEVSANFYDTEDEAIARALKEGYCSVYKRVGVVDSVPVKMVFKRDMR